MSKRELHTYVYECDGYLTDGRKCIEERRVEAFDSNAADVDITAPSGIRMNNPWRFEVRGWLCSRTHHGDTQEAS